MRHDVAGAQHLVFDHTISDTTWQERRIDFRNIKKRHDVAGAHTI